MAENNLNLQFHFIDWLVTALTLSQTAGKHTENSTALHTARGSVTHYTQNKTDSVQIEDGDVCSAIVVTTATL